NQPIFFGVPTAENNRAAGFPTLLNELTEPTCCFEHRSGTTIWIDRTKHPRVTEVTHYYPAIFFLVPIQPPNNLPAGAHLIIHIGFEMDLHFVCATEVISERESALETSRSDRSFQRRHQLARDVIRDGLYWNLGEVGRFLRFQSCYAGNRRL